MPVSASLRLCCAGLVWHWLFFPFADFVPVLRGICHFFHCFASYPLHIRPNRHGLLYLCGCWGVAPHTPTLAHPFARLYASTTLFLKNGGRGVPALLCNYSRTISAPYCSAHRCACSSANSFEPLQPLAVFPSCSTIADHCPPSLCLILIITII